MNDQQPIAIHWFRRDLRLKDNTALYKAHQSGLPVLGLFIFDTNILDKLEERSDARVTFIHRQIQQLQRRVEEKGGAIHVAYGKPEAVFDELFRKYAVKAVYTNRDYEPYARERDGQIEQLCRRKGVEFHTHKDHVILEPNEVLKDDGTPYTVYTPYSRKWKNELDTASLQLQPIIENWLTASEKIMPSLREMGFVESTLPFPDEQVDEKVIAHYHETRDIPSVKGTSRLSMHLRFGTISIRQLAERALRSNEKFLNELIWREFYQMILWHFPEVVDHNFKRKYDAIEWRNKEDEFKLWCEGRTGYPLVDAGMRELLQTGWMHNRVRMVTASFLTKHLLIDWRWGEAWFASKLLDFELASNNGGWQWAAGTGCDAAPYFRVFNPASQAQKFDPKGEYIRQWVPEFDSLDYARPMVEHAFARQRALDTYKKALNS
jgi:deoxyribodipyrimidine photo-lyase